MHAAGVSRGFYPNMPHLPPPPSSFPAALLTECLVGGHVVASGGGIGVSQPPYTQRIPSKAGDDAGLPSLTNGSTGLPIAVLPPSPLTGNGGIPSCPTWGGGGQTWCHYGGRLTWTRCLPSRLVPPPSRPQMQPYSSLLLCHTAEGGSPFFSKGCSP